MYSPDDLRILTPIFVEATGISLAALGRETVGNHKFFKGLLAGRDVMAGNAERVSHFYNTNWPPWLPWPGAVSDQRERPHRNLKPRPAGCVERVS